MANRRYKIEMEIDIDMYIGITDSDLIESLQPISNYHENMVLIDNFSISAWDVIEDEEGYQTTDKSEGGVN